MTRAKSRGLFFGFGAGREGWEDRFERLHAHPIAEEFAPTWCGIMLDDCKKFAAHNAPHYNHLPVLGAWRARIEAGREEGEISVAGFGDTPEEAWAELCRLIGYTETS